MKHKRISKHEYDYESKDFDKLSDCHCDRIAGLEKENERLREEHKNLPKIVCLCGSTRFYNEFQKANYNETMNGNIILSVGFYPHSTEQVHGEKIAITSEEKEKLDELHKRKIDLADEVFVLNVDGYIGESTKSEVEYAKQHDKPIRYLEQALKGAE